MEYGWHVYGPENGYNFPYPRLLRVNTCTYGFHFIIITLGSVVAESRVKVFNLFSPMAHAYVMLDHRNSIIIHMCRIAARSRCPVLKGLRSMIFADNKRT